VGGQGRWREVRGERRWREEVERKKKKKTDVAFHIRLWRFGCGDMSVSVAALIYKI
jgi:hypothetical protein